MFAASGIEKVVPFGVVIDGADTLKGGTMLGSGEFVPGVADKINPTPLNWSMAYRAPAGIT
jgi:hypothetical protein